MTRFESVEAPSVGGTIGADVLKTGNAIIDYGGKYSLLILNLKRNGK